MKQNVIVGLVAVAALVLGLYAAVKIAPPQDSTTAESVNYEYFKAYPVPRNVSKFALTNHLGEAFTPDDLKQQWTLVFTGYTSCPDVCPTTMAEISRIMPDLAKIPSSVPIQVLFVSVDPKRDTPDKLKSYLDFFNKAFTAVTGGHDQLFPFIRSMGMMYSMSESTDTPNYLVDHSASIVVINPQAQVEGRFKPQLSSAGIAVSDTAQILTDLPLLIAKSS